MSTKPRTPLDRPRRRHRWARRISPTKLQAQFLGLQAAARLQEYRKREWELHRAMEPYREQLAKRVDALERAARMLDNPADDNPKIWEQRALQLVVNAVARHWRRRPSQWLGREVLLPRIVGGEYFNALPDAIHWLDLKPEMVTEAIHHELKGLDDEKQPRRPRAGNTARPADEERERADLSLLTVELHDQFLQDPIATGASSLCHRVRARLIDLAWRSPSLAMRRFASKHLWVLDRAARPDLRSSRTHRRHRLKQRSREERELRARLAAQIQEDNSRLAELCGEQMKEDMAMVPLPLRIRETVSTAMTGLSVRRVRSDPAQPRAWLKRFRRAVPRALRQELIDTFDVVGFLEELDQAALQTPDVYMRVVYVTAARRLVARRLGPPPASAVKDQETERDRIARVFGLDPLEVARDIMRMRVHLEIDHKRWLARSQQEEPPSTPAQDATLRREGLR